MSTRPPFATPAGGSPSDAAAADAGIADNRTAREGSDWVAPDLDPYPSARQQPTQPDTGGAIGPGDTRSQPPVSPTAPDGTPPVPGDGTTRVGPVGADPHHALWERPAGMSAAGSPPFDGNPPDPDQTVKQGSGGGSAPGGRAADQPSGQVWWGTPWNPPQSNAAPGTFPMGSSVPPGSTGPGHPDNPFQAPPPPPPGPYYGSGQTIGSPVPPPRHRRLVAAAIALALVSAGVGGGVGALVAGNNSQTVVTSSGLQRSTGSSGTSPAASGTVSAAAQTILPSVVTIAASSSSQSSTGSGVIIRQDGYILTNNHVVSDATRGGSLKVTTQDDKDYNAKIVGTDPSSDLAVVKIDASGLKAATFGDSEALAVGELVIAVGSPLGLSGTVTSGIVSAEHRPVRTGDSSVQDSNAVLDAIQTDAPINPGNSGGPLVNSRGELVGINSAIATVGSGGGGFGSQQEQQSGNIGVGFAIPSNYAQTIAEELISRGSATHPYLGVSASTAGTSQADPSGEGTGAEVRQLVDNGPAQQGGLQTGDVITKLGDRRITSVDGLIAAVRSHPIGSKVTVTYTRGGQTRTTDVTLAAQPPS